MRTARVVLVATAIGATAGAAVVLSLIDRPATDRDKTASIAAHAIVTSAQAAPATTAASGSSASAALAAPVKVTTAVAPTAQAAPAAPKLVPAAPMPVAPQVAVQPPLAMQSSAPPQPPVVTQSATVVPPPAAAIGPSVSENSGNSSGDAGPPPKPATGIAALSDTLPASEAAPAGMSDQALIPPQTVPPDKKQKHHSIYASSPTPSLGGVLRRLFSPHPGNSYYPNR